MNQCSKTKRNWNRRDKKVEPVIQTVKCFARLEKCCIMKEIPYRL